MRVANNRVALSSTASRLTTDLRLCPSILGAVQESSSRNTSHRHLDILAQLVNSVHPHLECPTRYLEACMVLLQADFSLPTIRISNHRFFYPKDLMEVPWVIKPLRHRRATCIPTTTLQCMVLPAMGSLVSWDISPLISNHSKSNITSLRLRDPSQAPPPVLETVCSFWRTR